MATDTDKRRGRLSTGLPPARNRCIRLTDQQWETFMNKLGMDWLRKQITKAEKRNTDQ